jgi:hypothetical protein
MQNGVKMIGEVVRLVNSYAKALEGVSGRLDRAEAIFNRLAGRGRIGALQPQDQIRPKVSPPSSSQSTEQHAPVPHWLFLISAFTRSDPNLHTKLKRTIRFLSGSFPSYYAAH